MYSTGLRFSRIEVIESLPTGDLRTGEALWEEILRPGTQSGGPTARYHRIEGLDALESLLRKLAETARMTGSAPLLHLEAHGSEEALQLATGELMPWTDFAKAIAPINEASRMNLLVVAGACRGWYLTTGLMPADRAPLFMLIGAPEDVEARDLGEAHERFYRNLIAGLNRGDVLNTALSAMNEGQEYEVWRYKPATVEILFCRVFRQYLEDYSTPADLAERENELVAHLVRSRQLDVMESAILRQKVRTDLQDTRRLYDTLRETFLCLDLFPENRARFGLTYDLCLGTDA